VEGLDRFVAAQARNHAAAEAEIRAGRKTTHWMWYVFPQLRGIGRSETAQYFGISDKAEAAAYLAHPVLGPRLVQMATLMLQHEGRIVADILGPVDALKLRSCATLFAALPHSPPVFAQIIDTFYDGQACGSTRALLGL
jgi:uncharacterized protein (DUF1810 family)